jgi:hypothetical protein
MTKKKDVFEDTQIKDETKENVVQETSAAVEMTSPDWDQYLLSQFSQDELIDGRPLVSGLRRIAEIILGPTTFSGPTQVFPSTSVDHYGRATVVFTITFQNGQTYSDVADCWEGNTDDAFLPYTIAIASTRAEARALRKALRLKSCAAEEITSKDTTLISKNASRVASSKKPTDGEVNETELLSEKQDRFIDTLCERAGVNRGKFLELNFKIVGNERITKRIASESIDLLNSYINGAKKVPEEILV